VPESSAELIGGNPVTDAAELKARAARVIDAHAGELEALGRRLFAMPELGFKEHRTAAVVREWFDRMGLPHRDGLAITGSRADIAGGAPGPTVAISASSTRSSAGITPTATPRPARSTPAATTRRSR